MNTSTKSLNQSVLPQTTMEQPNSGNTYNLLDRADPNAVADVTVPDDAEADEQDQMMKTTSLHKMPMLIKNNQPIQPKNTCLAQGRQCMRNQQDQDMPNNQAQGSKAESKLEQGRKNPRSMQHHQGLQ